MCKKNKYEYPWDINDFMKDIQGLDGTLYKFISYDPKTEKVTFKSIKDGDEHTSSLYYVSWIKLSIRKI